jgi:predicted ester cyclase
MTTHDESAVSTDLAAIAIRGIHLVATGERAEFDELIDPGARNRDDVQEPPAARVPGPEGYYASALWLRAAFADLRYEIQHTVREGDLVAVNSTMRGRHVATFVTYTADGDVDAAFPPTGRTFASTQSHWFRFRDGKIIDHWANRDDLTQAKQLAWIPPTPLYLLKMSRAKSHARHA